MRNYIWNFAVRSCVLGTGIVSFVQLLQPSAPTIVVLHPVAFFVPLPIRPAGGVPSKTVIDWDAVLKSQVDALPTGKRSFNPPNVMQEGKNTRVEFRITKGDISGLVMGLKGPGTPQLQDIKVGSVM